CGDTSLPFYDALRTLDHGIEHILTRDERSAAYMADGYARVTGRVGVCEGPSGGGATYILPGLVEANESSVPVLAITTDVSRLSLGRYPLTELDQGALFKPLTKWNAVIERSELVPRSVRSAFRAMTTGRPGSAHLAFPFDVQRAPVPESELWAQEEHGSFPAWRTGPDPAAVERAVEAILSAERPVVLCGGGVVLSRAEAALERLVVRLNLPVTTTISGKGSLADTHPNCVGVVGSNGGVPATRAVLEGADLVVMIGCRAGSVTTERWSCPRPGVRVVHIDADPMVISASYRTEVAVVGDALLALEAIDRVLDDNPPRRDFAGASLAARAREAKRRDFAERSSSLDTPIRPERVARLLDKVLPRNSIVVADPGTPCPYLSAFHDAEEPGRRFITNRAHGALGYALAAALGAHYGRPSAKCVAVMGDGSFGFTSGELETVVRKELPITFIVLSNAVYGWIKAGQKAGFGERYFGVDFTRTDHAAVAQAFGLKSWRVEDPRELETVLRSAVGSDGPALVDVISQPLHEADAPVSEWIA
ncbi:MAG: thiamine pyrophosphate-binding protein, partial [Alphaproteobacteria bacterium]